MVEGGAEAIKLLLLRDQRGRVGIKNARGAGIEGGVDGEDQHESTISLFRPSWPGLSRSSTPSHGLCKDVDARDIGERKRRRPLDGYARA